VSKAIRARFKAELEKLMEIAKRGRAETDEFLTQNRRAIEAERHCSGPERLWVRQQVG
jgi:hypothetical protein